MSLYVQSDEIFPLRLIFGFGFMGHGYAKLLKGPVAFAPSFALLECLPALDGVADHPDRTPGGLSVLLGALVPLISVPMAGVLLVAMFSVHWRYGLVRSSW